MNTYSKQPTTTGSCLPPLTLDEEMRIEFPMFASCYRRYRLAYEKGQYDCKEAREHLVHGLAQDCQAWTLVCALLVTLTIPALDLNVVEDDSDLSRLNLQRLAVCIYFVSTACFILAVRICVISYVRLCNTPLADVGSLLAKRIANFKGCPHTMYHYAVWTDIGVYSLMIATAIKVYLIHGQGVAIAVAILTVVMCVLYSALVKEKSKVPDEPAAVNGLFAGVKREAVEEGVSRVQAVRLGGEGFESHENPVLGRANKQRADAVLPVAFQGDIHRFDEPRLEG